jgi:predicted nuclease of restriction endonuclease-like (RecB) superfamily
MRVENPSARGYYIGESISQNWSVRALASIKRVK